MAQTGMERLRELTNLLNQYRREYYDLNAPTVDDGEYDRLFDELATKSEKLKRLRGLAFKIEDERDTLLTEKVRH